MPLTATDALARSWKAHCHPSQQKMQLEIARAFFERLWWYDQVVFDDRDSSWEFCFLRKQCEVQKMFSTLFAEADNPIVRQERWDELEVPGERVQRVRRRFIILRSTSPRALVRKTGRSMQPGYVLVLFNNSELLSGIGFLDDFSVSLRGAKTTSETHSRRRYSSMSSASRAAEMRRKKNRSTAAVIAFVQSPQFGWSPRSAPYTDGLRFLFYKAAVK